MVDNDYSYHLSLFLVHFTEKNDIKRSKLPMLESADEVLKLHIMHSVMKKVEHVDTLIFFI